MTNMEQVMDRASSGIADLTNDFNIESRMQNITVNATTMEQPTPGSIPVQTQTVVPAELVELTNQVIADGKRDDTIVKEFALFVVAPDQNTGYALVSSNWSPTVQDIPEPIKQMMLSFGLVER
ncbi:MAG: hypothetical protein ACJ71D_08390 [Nitrososphaera sp.]